MKKLLLFCWLASLPAFGQAYSSSVTQNSPGNYGHPVPFAQIQVCTVLDNAVPCVSKVSTYVDQTLAVLCSQTSGSGVLGGGPSSGGHCNNPGIADANGNFTLFLQPGQYTICTNASTWLCQKVSVGGSGVQSSPIVLANCTAAGTTLNEGVNLSIQVIAGVPTLCGTTATANSTAIVGICASACGNSGSASIAYSGYQSCVLDNQSTQNDYVVPSSNPGQCHDIGASTSSANETLGIAASTNAGAGTLATILLAPLSLILPGSTGGAGTVSSCGSGVGANAYYPGIGTVVSCDPLITDDGAGHGGMRSLALTDSTVSGNWFEVAGPALPAIASIPIHSFAFSVNPSFGTSYGLEPWDNAPVNGNCISAVTGDATNYFKLHDTGAPCGTGSGTTIQTKGTPNTSQSPLNFQDGPVVSGLFITPSNPSAGNEQFSLSGPLPTFSQVPQPATPTLSVGGTPGLASVSYCVEASQDTAGTQHTQCSALATATTANATLSLSPITLSGYQMANNGTSARCFFLYRTAGGPSQGLIASCVDTQFIDNGVAGDGTTPCQSAACNTTVLHSHPQPLPACAMAFDGVAGIDAPNCTTAAQDDEFTWTGSGTFNIADTNDPKWAWQNQGGATASLSNGMMQLTAPTNASSDNLRCLVQPVPGATPYAFAVWVDMPAQQPNTQNTLGGLAWSDGTKSLVVSLDLVSSTSQAGRVQIFHYTNATTPSAVDTTSPLVVGLNGYYLAIKNDGANLKTYSSPDGVFYVLQSTEAIASFITPTKMGVCIDAFTGTGYFDFDYFRSIPTSRLP